MKIVFLNRVIFMYMIKTVIRKITLYPNEITPLQIKEIIEGSPSAFKGENKSVNYIASHDGFTLFDLKNCFKSSQSYGFATIFFSTSSRNIVGVDVT